MPTTGLTTSTGEPQQDPIARVPDDATVPVVVRVSPEELDEGSQDASKAKKTKEALADKFKVIRGDPKGSRGTFKTIQVSKEDYLKYWAQDNDGNYIGSEPEGEGMRLWAEELKSA